MSNPFIVDSSDSFLESITILSQLLRREGYSKDIINDIAINEYLENERQRIKDPATMHLLSLKKILLYAIPVVAPRDMNIGILLRSQVSCQAIQYDSKSNKTTPMALFANDKFRLIGFVFSSKLINHLDHVIFPWKYFMKYPIDYYPSPIDLSSVKGIQHKKSNIYLIDPKHYEDVQLFNLINNYIALALVPNMTSVLSVFSNKFQQQDFPELKRIKSFIIHKYIDKLNEVLLRQIDRTYNSSLYEALHMTANWLLYDQIHLLGFDSPDVNEYLKKLSYVKTQNLKVSSNLREVQNRILMNTRAEKITRERYPHLFDFTDRRAIFTKFNRFKIEKLPTKLRNEVQIILDKDIAAQKALLTNKCDHIHPLRELRTIGDKESFGNVEKYINHDSIDNDNMYSCTLCSQPILCKHELELHEALSSISDSQTESDEAYWVRQKIINKFKNVDQIRTGNEDTESSFTYYCKHCGGELGKSEDIIQSTIKSQLESSIMAELDPLNSSIYTYISAAVSLFMNSSIVPMSKRTMTKLIYDECHEEIKQYVKRATKKELDNIDLMVRYLSTVYVLSALISININKIKSSESILIQSKPKKDNETSKAEPVSGGADLKIELLSALKIVQNINTFKSIGITDDKIKTMLIEAFKFMNRTFSNESFQLKFGTPRDRLELDILSSPVGSYASFMSKRYGMNMTMMEVLGLDMNILFPKSKKAKSILTHSLFTNIYNPKNKESSEVGRYIRESYQSIVDFVIQEPIGGVYTSITTPPVSSFVKEYEARRHERLRLKRDIPYRFLPVENSREYDFTLRNYHKAYCLNEDGTSRFHKWSAVKTNSKVQYTCIYCQLPIQNAAASNNEKIEDILHETMTKEAFFELYTVSCPVKDAHVFETSQCSQCSVSKEQLESMDPKYYKRFSSVYLKHRDAITSEILDDAKSIMSYSKTIQSIPVVEDKSKVDVEKLESLLSSLSKLYGQSDLRSIGMMSSNARSLEIVESYVRLFYSHYTFVKNISMDTKNHPDVQFFSFVKESFFNGIKPKKLDLPELPEYPLSTNADQLLLELFQIIYDIASNSNPISSVLIKFIINKMAEQDSRRKEFNFAKLKSVAVYDEREELIVEDEVEEEEYDIFNGYDIDQEDAEDNIHGDID